VIAALTLRTLARLKHRALIRSTTVMTGQHKT